MERPSHMTNTFIQSAQCLAPKYWSSRLGKNQYTTQLINFSLVYHNSVCMNMLRWANPFFQRHEPFVAKGSSLSQLTVDVFPCLSTPELGNMSRNCGTWQIKMWMAPI